MTAKPAATEIPMIRKLSSGEYRLYSRKTDPKTGKRRNLGTFKSRAAAEKHERAVQYFNRPCSHVVLSDGKACLERSRRDLIAACHWYEILRFAQDDKPARTTARSPLPRYRSARCGRLGWNRARNGRG